MQETNGDENDAVEPYVSKYESQDVAQGKPKQTKTFFRGDITKYFSKFKNWVSFLTLICVGIYTGLTWAILVESHRATIISNRAWLAPSNFEFLKPIEDPDGPNFIAHYQNVGKIPALDIKNSMAWTALTLTKPLIDPRASPETAFWPQIDQTIRSVCRGSQPIDDGLSVFPSSTIESNMVSGLPEPSNRGDKVEINAGRQLIIVIGCLTYRTFGEVHHTGFCRYTTKERTGQWEILSCQVGNFAD